MPKVHPRARRGMPLSPLRYPGGKGPLADFFAELMARKGLSTYVEPYAGGAGAAIDLLFSGAADRIVINDLDPAIYAFWASVIESPGELIDRILSTPLTVDEWRRQKATYRQANTSDRASLGFATLYLNRTNRSGVMNAGVIGGVDQEGKYKIDARFDRKRLADRVGRIAARKSQIQVFQCDGIDLIDNWVSEESALIYADPPYFQKGASLYLNSFQERDHIQLASVLNKHATRYWILTYDDHDFIRQLYSDRLRMSFSLDYSAHKREVATELMVVSEALRDSVA